MHQSGLIGLGRYHRRTGEGRCLGKGQVDMYSRFQPRSGPAQNLRRNDEFELIHCHLGRWVDMSALISKYSPGWVLFLF